MGDLFNLNNILMKKLAIIVETLTKLIVLKLMNVDVLFEEIPLFQEIPLEVSF